MVLEMERCGDCVYECNHMSLQLGSFTRMSMMPTLPVAQN